MHILDHSNSKLRTFSSRGSRVLSFCRPQFEAQSSQHDTATNTGRPRQTTSSTRSTLLTHCFRMPSHVIQLTQITLSDSNQRSWITFSILDGYPPTSVYLPCGRSVGAANLILLPSSLECSQTPPHASQFDALRRRARRARLDVEGAMGDEGCDGSWRRRRCDGRRR
jgi:hypothetical protein